MVEKKEITKKMLVDLFKKLSPKQINTILDIGKRLEKETTFSPEEITQIMYEKGKKKLGKIA